MKNHVFLSKKNITSPGATDGPVARGGCHFSWGNAKEKCHPPLVTTPSVAPWTSCLSPRLIFIIPNFTHELKIHCVSIKKITIIHIKVYYQILHNHFSSMITKYYSCTLTAHRLTGKNNNRRRSYWQNCQKNTWWSMHVLIEITIEK